MVASKEGPKKRVQMQQVKGQQKGKKIISSRKGWKCWRWKRRQWLVQWHSLYFGIVCVLLTLDSVGLHVPPNSTDKIEILPEPWPIMVSIYVFFPHQWSSFLWDGTGKDTPRDIIYIVPGILQGDLVGTPHGCPEYLNCELGDRPK